MNFAKRPPLDMQQNILGHKRYLQYMPFELGAPGMYNTLRQAFEARQSVKVIIKAFYGSVNMRLQAERYLEQQLPVTPAPPVTILPQGSRTPLDILGSILVYNRTAHSEAAELAGVLSFAKSLGGVPYPEYKLNWAIPETLIVYVHYPGA